MDFPPDLKNLISELTNWYLPVCLGLCIIFGPIMCVSFFYYSHQICRFCYCRSRRSYRILKNNYSYFGNVTHEDHKLLSNSDETVNYSKPQSTIPAQQTISNTDGQMPDNQVRDTDSQPASDLDESTRENDVGGDQKSASSNNQDSPKGNQSLDIEDIESYNSNSTDLSKDAEQLKADQMHTAPSSQSGSTLDRDRSYSDSSKESSSRPSCNLRSFQAENNCLPFNQASGLANKAGEKQEALKNKEKASLEVKTKLQKDGFRRSCSIRSDSSRSGPSREDHSFSDNSRSLEERTSSNANTSRNSGERPRKMDAEQVVSILSKPVNFFEDRCEPQDSLRALPTHFEQSSYDDHRRRNVVSDGQGTSNKQRPVENDIKRTNLESTKRDRTFGDNAAGGDFLVQTPPSKQSSSRLSQGVATKRAGKHGAQYATDSNSASYRSDNWNTADPQHIRSQPISGQKTGTSNIIDSRKSRNKNSPDINQSNNCRNYETLYQNVSDLQKRTRCNESVSEVTPEGSRTFDRRSNSSRRRPSREDHFYNDHSRNLEEQTSSNASTSRNSDERPRKMDGEQVVSDLSKPVNFFEDGSRPQDSIKTFPTHPKQSSIANHRRQSVVPDTEDGDSETPAKDMRKDSQKSSSRYIKRESSQQLKNYHYRRLYRGKTKQDSFRSRKMPDSKTKLQSCLKKGNTNYKNKKTKGVTFQGGSSAEHNDLDKPNKECTGYTDQIHSALSPRSRSTHDRDRSHSDSSKESSSRPSCNSRSFQAENNSLPLNRLLPIQGQSHHPLNGSCNRKIGDNASSGRIPIQTTHLNQGLSTFGKGQTTIRAGQQGGQYPVNSNCMTQYSRRIRAPSYRKKGGRRGSSKSSDKEVIFYESGV